MLSRGDLPAEPSALALPCAGVASAVLANRHQRAFCRAQPQLPPGTFGAGQGGRASGARCCTQVPDRVTVGRGGR